MHLIHITIGLIFQSVSLIETGFVTIYLSLAHRPTKLLKRNNYHNKKAITIMTLRLNMYLITSPSCNQGQPAIVYKQRGGSGAVCWCLVYSLARYHREEAGKAEPISTI